MTLHGTKAEGLIAQGLILPSGRSSFECNVAAQRQSNSKTFLRRDCMSRFTKSRDLGKRPGKSGRTKSKKEKELFFKLK